MSKEMEDNSMKQYDNYLRVENKFSETNVVNVVIRGIPSDQFLTSYWPTGREIHQSSIQPATCMLTNYWSE